MSVEPLTFMHVYKPPVEDTQTTLVLLHGTGGDEADLLELGEQLAPGCGMLGIRGKVSENGANRFFRRLSEGVFDEADLRFRTLELATFLQQAVTTYRLAPKALLAVGYSNGANIAASSLLLSPDVFAGAVLFRAMLPLTPDILPVLGNKPVLIEAGDHDPIVPRERVEGLTVLLQRAGADCDVQWNHASHALTHGELAYAQKWVREKGFA